MQSYIDIHTHKPPVNNGEVLSVASLYGNSDKMIPGFKYSIGLHPAYLNDHETQFNIIEELAQQGDVLAIGECGLDKLVATPLSLQTKMFIKHIELADQLKKPLVVHCVKAHEELLAVFAKHPPTVPVIFHGYNNKQAIADRLIAKGHYLSFGAAIFKENLPAANALANTPTDQFFLETDDAAITIKDIYIKAAEIRKTTVDAIILQLQHNYKNTFPQ